MSIRDQKTAGVFQKLKRTVLLILGMSGMMGIFLNVSALPENFVGKGTSTPRGEWKNRLSLSKDYFNHPEIGKDYIRSGGCAYRVEIKKGQNILGHLTLAEEVLSHQEGMAQQVSFLGDLSLLDDSLNQQSQKDYLLAKFDGQKNRLTLSVKEGDNYKFLSLKQGVLLTIQEQCR